MHRRFLKQWAVGGLGLALAACGAPAVPVASQDSWSSSQVNNSGLNEVNQVRAQLPQRLLPSEIDALSSPPGVPGEASFNLMARTSNPHVGTPRGSGGMTATGTRGGQGSYNPPSIGGRGGHQGPKPGGQGSYNTPPQGGRGRHQGPKPGGQHAHQGPGPGHHPSKPNHHMGHRVHRDGWGRGYGGGYGTHWYYPYGDYLFPYSLGLDGAYYPYSGLDYPYFQWRDSRWWPSSIPGSWNLGVADDSRTWVVIQGGRFQPEVVTVNTLGTVVFFNADPTPQQLLIQDASGGTQVVGPINPGQVSQVVTFAAPGQYRFSNPQISGMQGWVMVN